MIAHLQTTALSNLMQVAWVTPDIDRSMAQFSELYRVPEFFVTEISYPARLFGETGEMSIRLALANVDNMQLELIQPLGGGIDKIYREALPMDGRHANVPHHLCIQVYGSRENWDDYLANLMQVKSLDYTGDLGPDVQFIYTDERATLGLWLEHVWYEPEYFKNLSAAIPTYRSA